MRLTVDNPKALALSAANAASAFFKAIDICDTKHRHARYAKILEPVMATASTQQIGGYGVNDTLGDDLLSLAVTQRVEPFTELVSLLDVLYY
ncbi:hypothetical protein [Novosphingobium sp. AP12]|uniref:hypothetical protein n=1 Tax=Novosphingobium sp. AP12 TaxID=1144305 RepID=UPI00055D549E|nr:hypothetical protein [Novosphingobium sp. AP12]